MDNDDKGVLVEAGFFKRVELALQKRRRHVAVLPLGDAVLDDLLLASEIDQRDAVSVSDRDLPVGALEIGAGNDPGFACRKPVVDPFRDRSQPGHSIGVVERMAGPHLLDIRRRMKVVTLLERPAEHALQFECDRRFAASRYAHQQKNLGRHTGRRFTFRVRCRTW
jgi:hypothetical protein